MDQWVDSWPGRLGMLISGIGLCWRWLTAYPLLVIERRKTRAQADLDQIKDEVILDLRAEITALRADLQHVRAGSRAWSIASPAPIPTSPPTPPSPPPASK
jgi:hypothetical protein